MDVVAPVVILAVLIAVVALVSSPLRARRRGEEGGEASDIVAELEARKEAKYREIRDAEMDLRTGKLSQDDHRILDRQLRAEAIEVLRALDEAAGR
ncbi:MAG: hypothetical protein QOJ85_144 [Solirubrobacteraceae bacterium]|nr:hypothetical protein [Solirubrobacteraceae bacterium]MEA2245270.1 hypothetical protein [Solirubrobacteraceae bacterium]